MPNVFLSDANAACEWMSVSLPRRTIKSNKVIFKSTKHHYPKQHLSISFLHPDSTFSSLLFTFLLPLLFTLLHFYLFEIPTCLIIYNYDNNDFAIKKNESVSVCLLQFSHVFIHSLFSVWMEAAAAVGVFMSMAYFVCFVFFWRIYEEEMQGWYFKFTSISKVAIKF